MNSDPLRKSRAAYTLVELIAVIVLAAVLAASAAPMIGTIGNARRAAALEAIRNDIAYARAHAIATGMRTWVNIDPQQNSWQLLAEPHGSPGFASAQPMSASVTGKAEGSSNTLESNDTAAFQSVDFDGGQTVGFDRLGRPLVADLQMLTAPGIVRVQLAGAVRVEPNTGHVRLTE